MPSLLERATAPFRRSGSAARADIQGLRAVAVLAVVADHAWGQPVGGFVGVDVFFVLSGFLITGLLIAERDRKGRISYLDFYRRRVRRLLPAACLVLAATVIASAMVYPAGRARSITEDAVWSFFFASNWHFAAVGTDYFASDGFTSPLQHFWSLAVEEQFYFVWPTLMVITILLAGRARRSALLVLTVAVTAASFLYSLHHTEASPTWAYFSTLDRAWELGAGALLAQLTPALKRMPHAVRPVLGWAGLIGIGVSLVVVTDGPGFPAPWAALPVLSTVAVLAAGTGSPQPWLFPLTNPVAGYLGDISYSLYLWHFPVVVLLASQIDPTSATYYVLAPLLGLVLAMLGYHLLEDPIRRSTWLEPRWKQAVKDGWLDGGALASRWIAIGTVVAAAFVTVVLQPQESDDAQLLAPVAGAAPDGQSRGDYQQERIVQSLDLKRFPDLSPPIDSLGNSSFFEALERQGCSNVLPDELGKCVYAEPGARRTAVIYGDSYAMAYVGMVRAALVDRGYRVQQMTLQECPVWDYDRLKYDGQEYPQCAQYRAFANRTLQQMKPDLLLLATSDKDASTLVSGATGDAAAAEVRDGVRRELQALRGAADRTVILAPPPGTAALQTCAVRGATPADCAKPINDYWYATSDIERTEAQAFDVEYLDTSPWFCAEGQCAAFVGNTPVTYDGSHLTYAYSTQLGPLLAEALFGRDGKDGRSGKAGGGDAAKNAG